MAENMDDLVLVPVDRSNVDQYIALIKALADYEHLEPPDQGAQARLARDVVSEAPPFWARLAYLDGAPVGYLTYYFTYSTFLAKPTLFLEDIFVLEQYRHRGIGKKLFAYCAGEAKRKGCGRMEWSALDWNAPAHRFYEGLGGKKMPWYLFRLLAEDFDKVL